MACTNCGGQSSSYTLPTTGITETTADINEVFEQPVKQGHPLSTACERANVKGAIPQVYNYPAYTVVGGELLTTFKSSSGGIAEDEMKTFFQNDSRLCYSQNAILASSCA